MGPSVSLKNVSPALFLVKKDICGFVGKILRQNGRRGRVTQRATTKNWILLANPAYSHLTPLVAQEGASNANGEAYVGACGRSPNLATWRFNWGSSTIFAYFMIRP